ncbi:hypothetical protein J2S65_004776 [Rhodococcus fascians]|nr:hypothetical protein [Rhodococcus fascians]
MRTPASRVPDCCIAARPSRSWRRSQTISFIRRTASLSIEPGSVALSAPASAKPTFVRVHLPQRPQLKLPSGFSQQTRSCSPPGVCHSPGLSRYESSHHTRHEDHEHYLTFQRPEFELLRQWCGNRAVSFQERMVAAEQESHRLELVLIKALKRIHDTEGDSWEFKRLRDDYNTPTATSAVACEASCRAADKIDLNIYSTSSIPTPTQEPRPRFPWR